MSNNASHLESSASKLTWLSNCLLNCLWGCFSFRITLCFIFRKTRNCSGHFCKPLDVLTDKNLTHCIRVYRIVPLIEFTRLLDRSCFSLILKARYNELLDKLRVHLNKEQIRATNHSSWGVQCSGTYSAGGYQGIFWERWKAVWRMSQHNVRKIRHKLF